VEYFGNKDLLKQNKTAFLCSRSIPASAVLKCYDWAIAQREEWNCIISGFHSQLEKEVFHYLLKGNQPIIIAVARGLKEKVEQELIKPLEQGRILISRPLKNIKHINYQVFKLIITHFYLQEILVNLLKPCIF